MKLELHHQILKIHEQIQQIAIHQLKQYCIQFPRTVDQYKIAQEGHVRTPSMQREARWQVERGLAHADSARPANYAAWTRRASRERSIDGALR